MTRDDILRMAIECHLVNTDNLDGYYMKALERFAELVATAERERMQWDGIHTCGPTCDNPFCVAVREAVAAECEPLRVTQQLLLEALQSLVAALVDADEDGLIEHADQIVAARAAIAKATVVQ
jgi:hypothetical protein